MTFMPEAPKNELSSTLAEREREAGQEKTEFGQEKSRQTVYAKDFMPGLE